MWIYVFAPASGGVLAGFFQLWNGVMQANFEALKPKKQEEISEVEIAKSQTSPLIK